MANRASETQRNGSMGSSPTSTVGCSQTRTAQVVQVPQVPDHPMLPNERMTARIQGQRASHVGEHLPARRDAPRAAGQDRELGEVRLGVVTVPEHTGHSDVER